MSDRMLFGLLAGAVTGLILAAGPVALAQQSTPRPGSGEGIRRDHSKAVRLQVTTQAQLQAIFDLGAELWSCEAGVGGAVDFVVSPAQLALIRAMGIPTQVLVDDVQAQIDAERERLLANAGRGAGPDGPGWFADYKTWPQVNAYIDALVTQRPDLASAFTVGTSIQGRAIKGIRISGPGAPGTKPAVIFNGCQHAREWIAVMVPMYIADQLVGQYETNQRIQNLVNQVEFFIVPITNPDGYEFTYATGGDRMWRKNRRSNGDGSIGVDLNRNWSVDWGGAGASTVPSSETYCGTGPFSEPETAALRDFIAARPQLVGSVDFHSYGQLVLQPLGYTTAQPVDVRLVDQIDGILNAGIYSVNGLSYSGGTGMTLLYQVSGAMRDWNLVVRRVFGHTIELRDTTTFVLPPAQIIPTGAEALEGILRMAEWSLERVQFMWTSGRPDTIDAGATTPLRLELLPLTSGPLSAGTATLYWRLGSSGAFTPSAMTSLGGDKYMATLPAATCATTLQYYLQVQSTAGPTYRSPSNAPVGVYQAQALGTQSIMADNFQTNMGWMASGVSAGAWQRGVPVNDPNWPYDPIADADGSGQCYLTQNVLGDSDVDSGSVVLTSPIIDMSNPGTGGVIISYDYFLRMSMVNAVDRLLVEINSTGGSGTWTPIALHGTDGSLNWRARQITQAELAALGVSVTSQMRVRFTANDSNPQSFVEAGVDNFRVRRVICNTPPCPADITGDLQVNINDLLAVINAWGPCLAPPATCPADITVDGQVNINDLLGVINAWGACP